MILPVVQWPNKVLETKASTVEIFDEGLAQFAKDMHETMTARRGIGLAANQVDKLARVIVVNIDTPYTFVNPKIISKEGRFRFKEGCLSFPSLYEEIDRAQKIVVRAQDINGVLFTTEAEGLFAVCLQHEIDHLEGIVFTKRMSRLKADVIKRKMLKR